MAPDEDEEPPEPARGGGRPTDEPSEKQLGFIKALKERLKIGDDKLGEVIAEVTRDEDTKRVEDLTRRQASEVIDELQIRAKEAGVDLDVAKASDKQVGFMLSLKRRAHLTDVEFAALLDEVAGVKEPAQVPRREASQLIDRLLKLVEGGGGGGGGPKKKSGGGAKGKPRPRVEEDRPPDKEPPPSTEDGDEEPPF